MPNDSKLSDTPERRGTCVVGGKVVVEAGAVTRRRVRCSAWLGVAVIGRRHEVVDVVGEHRTILCYKVVDGSFAILGRLGVGGEYEVSIVVSRCIEND